MKLLCSKCSGVYNLDDRLTYDFKFIAATSGKVLQCPLCGSPFRLQGLPKLFTEDEKKLLRGEKLKNEVIANLKKLYPMPHVTYKARKIMNSSHAGFKEIANILQTDPALASRILKIANSAYYGMSGKISSIQHAATLLGADTLVQIITLVSNSKMLGKSLKGYGINSGDLWKHSLKTAVCANILSAKCSPEDEEDAFFAGLMHDSGKIILDAYVVEREKIFNRYLLVSKAVFQRAEQRILGFDHAHTGYELCLKWNLPKNLANAIRYHHNPFISGDNKLAYIIHISDYIAKKPETANSDTINKINRSLDFLGLSGNGMEMLLKETSNAVEALAEDTY